MVVPVIRFEMQRKAYVRLFHPTAHLHVGMHGENRWPVARELTPRIFTLFVVKTYYGSSWLAGGQIPESENEFANSFDETYVREKESCQLLGFEMFHHHERGQLHLISVQIIIAFSHTTLVLEHRVDFAEWQR